MLICNAWRWAFKYRGHHEGETLQPSTASLSWCLSQIQCIKDRWKLLLDACSRGNCRSWSTVSAPCRRSSLLSSIPSWVSVPSAYLSVCLKTGTAVTGCCKSIKTFTDTDTTSGTHHISVNIWEHHRLDLPSHWFSSSKSCRRESVWTLCCLWRQISCRLSTRDSRKVDVHTSTETHTQITKLNIYIGFLRGCGQLDLNRWGDLDIKNSAGLLPYLVWWMDNCVCVCVGEE